MARLEILYHWFVVLLGAIFSISNDPIIQSACVLILLPMFFVWLYFKTRTVSKAH